MNRTGRVLDGAHEVELVLRRIEFGHVRQDLEQPERQHDRFVRPLLVDDVEGDVAGGSDAANGDASGVEAPVLGERRRRCQGQSKQADW